MAKTDIGTIACASVSIAIGAFVILSSLGLIPSKGAQSEQLVGFAIGSSFMLGGSAVIVQTFARGRGMRRTQFLLSLGILASLATIQTWVAFGPGDRQFQSSTPFLPSWAGEPVGRAAFALGAMLCWAVFLAAVAIGLARRRNGDPGVDRPPRSWDQGSPPEGKDP